MANRDVAIWRRSDRDRFIRLIRRLGPPWHLSHNSGRDWSAFVVFSNRSKHVTFEETGHVYFTQSVPSARDLDACEWLPGGFRAWMEALEIKDSDIAELFIDGL